MKIQNNIKSQQEISRLIQLGFCGFRPNLDGVFVEDTPSDDLKNDEVHFPETAYSEEWMKFDSVWGNARAKLIQRYLQKHKVEILWEIGAGNGLVAIPLQNSGITVIASDPIYSGMKQTAEYGILSLHARFKDLKLPRESISAIGIFDVLEHIEEPKSFLNDLYKVMKIDGLLFVTVPAHSWLYSDFDKAVGHFRRYSRRQIDNEIVQSGFKRIDSKYFFFSLVIPALFLRRIPYLLGRRKAFESNKGIRSEIKIQTRIASWFKFILKPMLAAESHFRVPFGLSVIGIYERDELLP